MKKAKIFSLLSVTMIGVLITSCSKTELDRVNRNLNNPTNVQAKFIITDLITSTAFNVAAGDISLYSSIYVEHEAGVWNQTYNAETRTGEPQSATTYNNAWGSIYNNIKAAKIAIAKTSEGGDEAGNDVTCGIAKVLLAYNLGVLTDFFGDVPFSQSGITNPDGSPAFMQPEIEKQSALYPQILALLDEAIVLFASTDHGPGGGVSDQDLLYGGSKGSWLKAAYGLKARYTMRTLKVSADVNGDLAKVLDYVSKSFESPDDEMLFNVYDGSTQLNPLFGFSNTRDALGVSQSLATKFKDLNDPRGEQAFMDYDFVQLTLDDALAAAAPNGTPLQQQFVYPISMAEYATTAPTEMLSYHEIKFLEAEALVRLGQTADAEPVLQDAITAAFANLERSLNSTNDSYDLGATIDLGETVATDYFTNQVLPRFATDPLKETMLQKYLAFYGASGESTEAYNDYRRLKALNEQDFIGLANPLNAQNKFPLRFGYGNSDVSANPNIKSAYGDGSYVYSENVWWAGGSR